MTSPIPRPARTPSSYDRLGYRGDDITRESRYTRYTDDRRMLRSHSTALIPPALRALAADPADDVLLVCPALVYRRDSIDRLHTGTPHQADLWRLTRRPVPLTTADLDEVGRDRRMRTGRPAPPSRGLARRSGWSGLALGLGLDRMLMLIKGIPDIRILRSARPAVAAQLADLSPTGRSRPCLPSAGTCPSPWNQGDQAEDLGDRVRDALGPYADCVEMVEILAQTPYADLPPQGRRRQGRRRLGAHPDQKNVLVKVVLRHLERTLTDHDANQLRDRIYAAVHQGTAHQWAAGSPAGPLVTSWQAGRTR